MDPIQLDPSGGTAIDFYVPSRNGKYVAVSLSKGGSESGDVHIYESATGKSLPDVVPGVNGGTAGAAWPGMRTTRVSITHDIHVRASAQRPISAFISKSGFTALVRTSKTLTPIPLARISLA